MLGLCLLVIGILLPWRSRRTLSFLDQLVVRSGTVEGRQSGGTMCARPDDAGASKPCVSDPRKCEHSECGGVAAQAHFKACRSSFWAAILAFATIATLVSDPAITFPFPNLLSQLVSMSAQLQHLQVAGVSIYSQLLGSIRPRLEPCWQARWSDGRMEQLANQELRTRRVVRQGDRRTGIRVRVAPVLRHARHERRRRWGGAVPVSSQRCGGGRGVRDRVAVLVRRQGRSLRRCEGHGRRRAVEAKGRVWLWLRRRWERGSSRDGRGWEVVLEVVLGGVVRVIPA